MGFLFYFPSLANVWAKLQTFTLGIKDNSLTANRVLYSDASKQLKSSSVTDTEIGYVSGVTGALQTALDSKYSAINRQTAIVNSEISTVDASKITTGTMATARLGSGVADATNFLRGDQTYAVPIVGSSMTAQGIILSADQSLSSTILIDITNMTFTLPNTGKKAIITFFVTFTYNTSPYLVVELFDAGVSKVGVIKSSPTSEEDSLTITYMATCSGQIVKIQGRVPSGSLTIGGTQTYRKSSCTSIEGAT